MRNRINLCSFLFFLIKQVNQKSEAINASLACLKDGHRRAGRRPASASEAYQEKPQGGDWEWEERLKPSEPAGEPKLWQRPDE